MNSRLTLVLAGFLLVGAVVTGYWGLTLSRDPVARSTAPADVEASSLARLPAEARERVHREVDEQRRTAVVVLARDVKPLVPITNEDLAIERLRIAPPDSFASPDALIGRTLWRETPAGTVLNQAALDMGGPLARMIRSEERAIAVAVDEVIGGGGHLRPGDYVDVLLHLRQDELTREHNAQVLIPALRILSVGDELGVTNQGEAAQPHAAADEDKRRRRVAATTAVLAVPEPLLTRFMLATQVGNLRLAVRSLEERLLAGYYAGDAVKMDIAEAQRQLFRFERLASRGAARPQPGLAQPVPAGIQVYRGNDVTRQTP
ncbi:Flp pilus assembly protein CpaB [Phytopseudomonas dryadis]|uniref:Flp pilus assembly protein CpaB n=1 Tax=Phytopseudomonas dryadis TaxID=2487520 RepID=A0A4Q9R1R0_9GAMM|nr:MULTISPECIES: Flp pilus assembly protein CpaB [Pseudomonas]TBU92100.1 Flp pilus assembly protein CpaB [Pseudomonas dryadis]TBV05039.1 Flp pilus assembly protein CpaB [Pseudomonas dryadis]TBV16442.1 Flp pilus assembly protein CpaB [Pseudomonas sp. FRB 230]